MYNQSSYNSSLYNRYDLGVWTATGEAVSETIASLIKRQFLSGSGEVLTESTGLIVKQMRFLSGQGEAITEASTPTFEIYVSAEFTIDSTMSLITNDITVIDTDAMTITVNGTLYMAYIEDDSVFFNLLPGVNAITFTGTGTVDIEVSYKDRWY